MPVTPDPELRTLTLEAFADTVLPGEKRHPGDLAIAGAAPGGGAVQAGALDVLETAEGGMAPALGDLAEALNKHAEQYRAERNLPQDTAPPFAGLDFEQRTELVQALLTPGHPEHGMWVGLAMFCFMAFDTGAHMHTADAFAAGHPGLSTLGFTAPGPDGLWSFDPASYKRALAEIHPDTEPRGSLR